MAATGLDNLIEDAVDMDTWNISASSDYYLSRAKGYIKDCERNPEMTDEEMTWERIRTIALRFAVHDLLEQKVILLKLRESNKKLLRLESGVKELMETYKE